MNINGNPTPGYESFEGLIYAGSQCTISGNPVMYGQLICKGDPNPPGSEDWSAENVISGQFELIFNCGGLFTAEVTPIYGRMWDHVW